MTDIVERLRVYATDDHERGCDGRYYACACGYDDKRDPLLVEAADEIERLREWNSEIALNAREFAAENERLRIENIQMQAALGYPIMAEDERHILPTNPYKCGTCDASSYLRAENSSLSAWQCVYTDGKTGLVGDEHGNQYCAMAKENERLRAALREILGWHDYSNDMHKPIEVRAAYMRARAALDGQPAPGKEEA